MIPANDPDPRAVGGGFGEEGRRLVEQVPQETAFHAGSVRYGSCGHSAGSRGGLYYLTMA